MIFQRALMILGLTALVSWKETTGFTTITPFLTNNNVKNHPSTLSSNSKNAPLSNLYQNKILSAEHSSSHLNDNEEEQQQQQQTTLSRRSLFQTTASTVLLNTLLQSATTSLPANAAVGTLPEFADTNAILQGVTITVSDTSQQDTMIEFLTNGFNFVVLRQRKNGPITDTWLGFGPEQTSIPSDFELPVSSFATYGGHASIHIRYDAQTTNVFYTAGSADLPGDSIAYLQVGVPEYRISQMVKSKGVVTDAYGIVNIISPSGLPFRGIVGISPDPLMFIAINCQDVQQSLTFYQQLGFVEQEYPYCRPGNGTGQIEPPQPKGSIYVSPSPNSMGVLLLPNQSGGRFRKTAAAVKPNPVVQSLNIVYTPSDGGGEGGDENEFSVGSSVIATDPSQIPISFQSVKSFEREVKATKVVVPEES